MQVFLPSPDFGGKLGYFHCFGVQTFLGGFFGKISSDSVSACQMASNKTLKWISCVVLPLGYKLNKIISTSSTYVRGLI